MKRRTLEEVLENLYKRYKCVNEEDVWVENCKDYLLINWPPFMDDYINMYIIRCMAKYLRKYTRKPIWAANVLLPI